MNKFFLNNNACSVSDVNTFIEGMLELNAIKAVTSSSDELMKHDSIWDNCIKHDLFNFWSQESQVVIHFIEQLSTIDTNIYSMELFESEFPNATLRAFLGIYFQDLDIELDKQITNIDDFKELKNNNLWTKVNSSNLWDLRGDLFPNLCLCDSVEEQCLDLGSHRAFNQILHRLKELDVVASDWIVGGFDYKEIKANGLNISPESKTTMQNEKYVRERTFSLPNGRREIFELHLKIDNIRIHIYPDNNDKKIYIGYIGKHLGTVKFN